VTHCYELLRDSLQQSTSNCCTSLHNADSRFFPALCASSLHFALYVPPQQKARYCQSPVNVVVNETTKSSNEHSPKNSRALPCDVGLCSVMLEPHISDFMSHTLLLYPHRCWQPIAVVLIFRLSPPGCWRHRNMALSRGSSQHHTRCSPLPYGEVRV